MIDHLIALSIRRGLAVVAAGLVLGLWGIFAVSRTPIDAIPDLSENQVIVYADWPGHGPREVEDLVTYPLAVELQGVKGVRVVRSSSDMGYSWHAVIFHDAVGFVEARQALSERLARRSSSLPAGVEPRLAPDSSATGQIFWYALEGDLDLGRLRAIQDFDIKPQLASVPGVAEVASVGGTPIELQVNVNPQLLRLHKIPIESVVTAVSRSNTSAGGGVIQKGNAEFVVRSVGRLGGDDADPRAILRDLENVPITRWDGGVTRLADVASVAMGVGPRRGLLEKDGIEITGGVVSMVQGQNPREVTERVKDKVRDLQAGLPPGVRILPFYDRIPLIEGAIGTVTGTLVEAIITSTICVVLVLLHLRAAFVIAITLPLAALGAFVLMWICRIAGIADVQTNVMSLAGIAISIGVLVDSSIVMTENAMHRLRDHFGDRPVTGDLRSFILPACQAVGRPIFFSIVIMLISFLPVFALEGMEGKMFRPLAVTKCFALITTALLAITLVPALCTFLLRGRMRGEMESPLVRGVIEVYRPILSHLLDRPQPLFLVLAVTFLVGLAPVGSRTLSLCILGAFLVLLGLSARTTRGRVLGMIAITLVALAADMNMKPLDREFMMPLDEGMIMDMPITVPRASITQSGDDLKARNMILCRFPEVDMVVGKAGRAETPTDPAPLDMIETMVNFRPRDSWPKRKLLVKDARRQTQAAASALEASRMIGGTIDAATIDLITSEAMTAFNVMMREYGYQRHQEYTRAQIINPAKLALDGPDRETSRRWGEHVDRLNDELLERGASLYTRLAIEGILSHVEIRDPALSTYLAALKTLRAARPAAVHHAPAADHAMSRMAELPPGLRPVPALDQLQEQLSTRFAHGLSLWQFEREEMLGFGGELDQAVLMPGWTNVWTMPIQNRVDMLATGVNTTLGVRVLGRSLDDVVSTSNRIAEALKRLPGAADVVADPIRGKGYVEVKIDRARALRSGIDSADVDAALATAIGGQVASVAALGRERHPIRVRYDRDHREDEDAIKHVLVASSRAGGPPAFRPLGDVADVVSVEGPATIKSENGRLRNYVRLNVRGRRVVDFVAEARRAIPQQVRLPEGTTVEWTGQFEHEERASRALAVLLPIVLGLIFLVLYATYRDAMDAALMMLAVPGAIAGGVFFQWLLGYKFSVTVWVGYIACFGMATSTGIIMLVYLREAVEQAGGVERLNVDGLKRAVLDGAAHRLRPKLLTEGTTLLGLAPMLWATGVGSEVIRPMAAPVIGGLLIADEVIDLLLPVLFYQVRRRRIAKRLQSEQATAILATPAVSPSVPVAEAPFPRTVLADTME